MKRARPQSGGAPHHVEGLEEDARLLNSKARRIDQDIQDARKISLRFMHIPVHRQWSNTELLDCLADIAVPAFPLTLVCTQLHNFDFLLSVSPRT